MNWIKSIFFALVLSLAQPSLASSSQVGEFAAKIADLNHCVEFSVTSWFRSEHRNEAVGGAKESQHLKGLAVDVVLDNPEDTGFFLRKLDKLGYYYLDEGDHIHIGYREAKDVPTRNSYDVGIGSTGRNDEIMVDANTEREAEARAVHASLDSGSRGAIFDQGDQGQRLHVDSESNSTIGGGSSNNLAEDGRTILRYTGGLRVDRIQSGVLVFHRGEGGVAVAHDTSEHDSDNPPRHPHGLSDNRPLFWREYSWPQMRYRF